MSILGRFRKAQAPKQVDAFIADKVAYRDEAYRVMYVKIDNNGIWYGLSGRFSDMTVHGVPQSEITVLWKTKDAQYQGPPLLWPGDQVVVVGTDKESVVKYVIAKNTNPYWNYFVGDKVFTDKDYPSKIKKVERGQLNMFEGMTL